MIQTPTTLTIAGGNAISPPPGGDTPDCSGSTYGVLGPCEADVTHSTLGLGFDTFSFHWAYTTADTAGPAGDIFGVLVNGVRTILSDPGGPISQSGNLTLHATNSLGWFVNCTDCIGGAATATITNFARGRSARACDDCTDRPGVHSSWYQAPTRQLGHGINETQRRLRPPFRLVDA